MAKKKKAAPPEPTPIELEMMKVIAEHGRDVATRKGGLCMLMQCAGAADKYRRLAVCEEGKFAEIGRRVVKRIEQQEALAA